MADAPRVLGCGPIGTLTWRQRAPTEADAPQLDNKSHAITFLSVTVFPGRHWFPYRNRRSSGLVPRGFSIGTLDTVADERNAKQRGIAAKVAASELAVPEESVATYWIQKSFPGSYKVLSE